MICGSDDMSLCALDFCFWLWCIDFGFVFVMVFITRFFVCYVDGER